MKNKISRCPSDSFRVIDLEVTGPDFVDGVESSMEETKFEEEEDQAEQ
jgi:hypothetical protein